MSLEQMADVGLTYQPDAKTAPELFADVNLAPRIISEQNAFLIQDMMRDVIRRGTGVRAGGNSRRRDLSGKTGTSNDRRDAWFAGFNSDMSAVAWVGYDDDRSLGPREEGSRTALPIWITYARSALDGVPEHQMPMPEGIVKVRIAKSTGCPATSATDFSDVMFESFRDGHVPVCDTVEAAPDPFNLDDDLEYDVLAVEPEEKEEEETLF